MPRECTAEQFIENLELLTDKVQDRYMGVLCEHTKCRVYQAWNVWRRLSEFESFTWAEFRKKVPGKNAVSMLRTLQSAHLVVRLGKGEYRNATHKHDDARVIQDLIKYV